MKKSFILHVDSLDILDELTMEQRGELFTLIRNFHNPNKPKQTQITQLVSLVFFPFKTQFQRDLQTYDNVVERNKINGSKGGRPKNKNPEKPRKADSDNDSKNDSGNDSKNEKKIFIHPLEKLIADKFPNIGKLKIQPTLENFQELETKFGFSKVEGIFMQMENYKKLTTSYNSVYLTAKNWLERDIKKQNENNVGVAKGFYETK